MYKQHIYSKLTLDTIILESQQTGLVYILSMQE